MPINPTVEMLKILRHELKTAVIRQVKKVDNRQKRKRLTPGVKASVDNKIATLDLWIALVDRELNELEGR